VYTGTHDNDTTAGWFAKPGGGAGTRSVEQDRAEREAVLRYISSDGREIHWDFIRTALSSVADRAIFPMQDALGLGSEARMNVPASVENNWSWRMRAEQVTPELSARLLGLSRTYGRVE
jgi:4-alpha-glucanotransferase